MKKMNDPDWAASKFLNTTSHSLSSKRHQFRHQKSFPLPKSPKTSKSISRAHVVLQKNVDLSFEQKHCIPNQKYSLAHLETLKQRHISGRKVKEQWVAARNLKLISLQMQRWISSKIHQHIQLSPSLEQQGLPQLIEKREERHFQIDRVMKYLSSF